MIQSPGPSLIQMQARVWFKSDLDSPNPDLKRCFGEPYDPAKVEFIATYFQKECNANKTGALKSLGSLEVTPLKDILDCV